jgi:gluconokinase
MEMNLALRVVIMGVSGCGKSTVGKLLAQALGGVFLDGDELHPEASITKMASGTPLTDEDREPWLRDIGVRLASAEGTVVIACSALKRSYRDLIRSAARDIVFVHLHGSRELLAQRMAARPGHFMPGSLLDSQLATLEKLSADEHGGCFDISQAPAAIAAAAAVGLRSPQRTKTLPHFYGRNRTC